MRAEIYWVENDLGVRIAVMPRPRGGDWLEDEIRSLREAGADVLVSLLTTAEVTELNLAEEPDHCQSCGVEFLSFPILDREVPPLDHRTAQFIGRLASLLDEGQAVAIHCRAGIGRASLIAASVLTLRGVAANRALDQIALARKCSVPDTSEQRAWVAAFAERGPSLLADGGGSNRVRPACEKL
jgi:protein-tyrosine phosphatase